MTPRSRFAAYAVAMVSALAGGMVAGREVGPIHTLGGHMGMAGYPPAMRSTKADPAPAVLGASDNSGVLVPDGLAVTQAGYQLQTQAMVVSGEWGELFRFRITGADGADVAALQARPQSELSMVVVSRDLDSYHRLYPYQESDGSWAVALPALAAGAYRVYADFAPVGGPDLILGTDLMVPGDAQFDPLPAASNFVVVDGYEVTFHGIVTPAAASELVFTVTQNGLPVEDLLAWYGARGHVMAVRVGDLAAVRADPVDGGGVVALEVPSPGDYRLFYEFARSDQVHVAAFTVTVPAGEVPVTDQPAAGASQPMESG